MTFTHTYAGPSSFTINSAGGLTEQMHFTILLTPYIYINSCHLPTYNFARDRRIVKMNASC